MLNFNIFNIYMWKTKTCHIFSHECTRYIRMYNTQSFAWPGQIRFNLPLPVWVRISVSRKKKVIALPRRVCIVMRPWKLCGSGRKLTWLWISTLSELIRRGRSGRATIPSSQVYECDHTHTHARARTHTHTHTHTHGYLPIRKRTEHRVHRWRIELITLIDAKRWRWLRDRGEGKTRIR